MSEPLSARYRVTVDELARARVAATSAHIVHARARVDGFQSSLASSIQGRDRDADAHAIDAYAATLQADLQVALLEDERLLVRDMMKHRDR